MTAAFLQSELTNLISDSKRKHADVKAAAERSLVELKSISVTSETQLAGDLIRKSTFVDPFVLACRSKNVRLASSGAACLQRLVASIAIPRTRLLDLLQAFEEAIPLGLEVQLKVLQTLPSLLQLYAPDLHGEALSRTLSVSADLSSNKLPMVSSTASATFQQLLEAVFTKATVCLNDRQSANPESESAQDTEDAVAIFIDLCGLLLDDKCEFVRLEKLPPPLILESVESLLSTYGTFILHDDDALKACGDSLIPGLLTLIENSASYPLVVRAFRITFVLTTKHLSQTSDALANLLKLILRIEDRGGNHKWKRILVLEFYRGICSDFEAMRHCFALFDMSPGKTDFVSDLMASLVRIASEDPSLIGLGRQSTIPSAVAAENDGDLARAVDIPVPVGSVAQAESSSIGVSAQGSTIQTPCLDQYDRSAPAEVPETYIFTLILGCISAFSDGLSKFIMPLSVPNRKSSVPGGDDRYDADDTQLQQRMSSRNNSSYSKHQQLINPLTRKDISRLSDVEECAKMIESCWPAVLATCSTFLNAALDSYFYHLLIRTVQKLTQVSGVLDLNIPRDAFLTTLAKVSVPANVSSLMNIFYAGHPACQNDSGSSQNGEAGQIQTPILSTPKQSIELLTHSLNVRNLLCLRALLNLGIALGPTLSSSAWTILWQSLEQVEALMSVNPATKAAQGSSSTTANEGSSPNTLAAEITAVDTARRRMIDSTSAYAEPAFQVICKSLFQMIEDIIPVREGPLDSIKSADLTLRPKATTHKSTRSVSGSWAKASTLEIEVQFVLKFIGRLASVNLHRFKQESSRAVSWDLIVATLLSLQRNQRLLPHLRLQCANIIDAIVVESCTTSSEEEDENDEDIVLVIQKHGIPALQSQIEGIQYHSNNLLKSSGVEVQTVLLMLEALYNVIGSCGEDFDQGWKATFAVLSSVTSHRALRAEIVAETPQSQAEGVARLYSAAFKITRLISSDFLSNLDDKSLADLLAQFTIFGRQGIDLNMSLTTITLYWNVAGFIEARKDFFVPFVEAVDPTSSKDTLTEDRSYSNLWHLTVLRLRDHCMDIRSDSRNAAVKMLAKIVETSIPLMSSATLNSYYVVVCLPLLDFYAQQLSDLESPWKDTIFKFLHDFVHTTQLHPALLIGDGSFHATWMRLIASARRLLQVRDVALVNTTYDALTDVVTSLRQSDASATLVMDRSLLEASWTLWISHDPTTMKLEGQTQTAFASFVSFLLAMGAWNFGNLSSIENVTLYASEALNRVIYGASHDPYTIDVNKTSAEQDKVLEALEMIKRLSINDEKALVLQILSFTRNLTERATTAQLDDQPLNSRNGVRQPTGVAFSTACIEKLRAQLTSQAASTTATMNYPFRPTLETCIYLIQTKYSVLPTNPKSPLWQKATLLAAECMEAIKSHCENHQQLDEIENLTISMGALLNAVFEVNNLEKRPTETHPPTESILTDEEFDVTQFPAIHRAAHRVLIFGSRSVPQFSQRQYILALFNHSLVARTWYNDLVPDLENNPLVGLTKTRLGSIRTPIVKFRQKITREALQCLFSLVATPTQNTMPNDSLSAYTEISILAAPYVLLRFAHTLKTFLADQPLRYLQHPHRALQHELHTILRAFLDLRVTDEAFTPAVDQLGLDASTIQRDGKSHLRIMTGLVTKFEKMWRDLPRLKKGLAWQDYEDGQGVENCLVEWREILSRGTTVRF